jgi:hypothetical protein
MREIRPSGDRRKGPLLNSGDPLRLQPRSCLWMCCRRLKGGRGCFCATPFRSHIAFSGGKDFLLGLSCFNLLAVLIHSVIPFLKFCVGQKVHVGFGHAAFPAITAVGKGLDAYVAVDASGTFSETKRPGLRISVNGQVTIKHQLTSYQNNTTIATI